LEWRKRVAIVAHPYAPLGGCYDDPVVSTVAATILKQGFIVGTFNFRYAHLALLASYEQWLTRYATKRGRFFKRADIVVKQTGAE
jgi:hypothetical protein